MKSIIQRILIKVANKINPHNKFISERNLFSALWIIEKGDTTLATNFNLNEESIVFDVGGYQGDWANKIYSKYKSNIHIFEPSKEFANKIKCRFNNNNK